MSINECKYCSLKYAHCIMIIKSLFTMQCKNKMEYLSSYFYSYLGMDVSKNKNMYFYFIDLATKLVVIFNTEAFSL